MRLVLCGFYPVLITEQHIRSKLLVSVVATNSEPFPGWIDNLYGATGAVVATVTGIMRTLHCDPDKLADVVPADMVVNALIVTAWKTHTRYSHVNIGVECSVTTGTTSKLFCEH